MESNIGKSQEPSLKPKVLFRDLSIQKDHSLICEVLLNVPQKMNAIDRDMAFKIVDKYN